METPIKNVAYRGAAFITPGFEEYETWRLFGGVYDADGSLIKAALRDEDTFKHAPPQQLPETFDAQVVVPKGVFLGHWFWHFGHFLVETAPLLSNVMSGAISPDTKLLFFAVGFHLFSRNEVADVRKTFLEALGIDPARIVFVNRPTTVLDLIVPSKPYVLNQSYCPVFPNPLASVASACTTSAVIPRKGVYLSRRALPPDPSRFCLNEYRLERFYASQGYVIARPEELPLKSQVALVSGAAHIVGLDGSALYLMGFASGARVTCFALRDISALSQFAGAHDLPYQQILIENGSEGPYAVRFEDLERVGISTDLQGAWDVTRDDVAELYELNLWKAARLLAAAKVGDAAKILMGIDLLALDARGFTILIAALERDGRQADAARFAAIFWSRWPGDPGAQGTHFKHLLASKQFESLANALLTTTSRIDARWLDHAFEMEVAGGPALLSEDELLNCLVELPLCLRLYRILARRFEAKGMDRLATGVTSLGRERLGVFWA